MSQIVRVLAIPLAAALCVVTAAAAADMERGTATYEELCAKCHGPTGKGDGKDAATLTTKPKDLTDCTRMKAFSDEQLFKIVKEGGAASNLSKDMPPYGYALEDDEIRDVIAHIRSLCSP